MSRNRGNSIAKDAVLTAARAMTSPFTAEEVSRASGGVSSPPVCAMYLRSVGWPVVARRRIPARRTTVLEFGVYGSEGVEDPVCPVRRTERPGHTVHLTTGPVFTDPEGDEALRHALDDGTRAVTVTVLTADGDVKGSMTVNTAYVVAVSRVEE